MSSKTKPKIFLQKKRTLSIHSKNSKNKNEEPELKKGPWSEQEDQLLIKWVKTNGACNWTKCSDFIKGRSGKQCREHWNNSLDPQLTKGQWTAEEDLLIMVFYKKYDGSWKRIIPIFEKRTENSIKNRFFSQLRKIASKYHQTGKKEYSTKFGLETLMKYWEKGKELAEQKFFSEKTMNKKEFEEYVNKIDILVKNRKKGKKFIDLSILKNNGGHDVNNYLELNEDEDEDGDEEEENINKKQNMETPRKRKKRGRKKIEQKNAQKKQITTFKKAKSTQKTNDLSDNKDLNDNNKKGLEIKRSKSKIINGISKDEEKPAKVDNSINQNKEVNDIQNNKNDTNNENNIKRKNTINNKSKEENNKVRKESIISSKSTGIEDYSKKVSGFDLNDKNSFRITPCNNNQGLQRKDTLDDFDKQNRRNELKCMRHKKNKMIYQMEGVNSKNYRNIIKNGFKDILPQSFDNIDKISNNLNFKNFFNQFEYDNIPSFLEKKETKNNFYWLRSKISLNNSLSKYI